MMEEEKKDETGGCGAEGEKKSEDNEKGRECAQRYGERKTRDRNRKK